MEKHDLSFMDLENGPKKQGVFEKTGEAIKRANAAFWDQVRFVSRFTGVIINSVGVVVIVLLVARLAYADAFKVNPMKGLDPDTQRYAQGIVDYCGNQNPWADTGPTCELWLKEYVALKIGQQPVLETVRNRNQEQAQAALGTNDKSISLGD